MGNCLNIDVESKYAVVDVRDQKTADVRLTDAEDATALLTGSLAYSTWVEINLKCNNLRHADALSKSDPFGVLYERRGDMWAECGRTEMVANSYDPTFVRRFRVLYNFEKVQKYRVVVVDIDKGEDPETISIQKCGFLGAAEFILGELVAAEGKILKRGMVDKEDRPIQSSLALTVEEVSNCKDHYRFQLRARNLKNVDMFGKSDPFLQICRLQEDGVTWLPVYKTETLMNTLHPTWKEIHIRAAQLNNGDLYRTLRLQAYDYEKSGSHRLLGYCDLSTLRLQELATQHGATVSLLPPIGKSAGKYGDLEVLSFSTELQPSFLDYVMGGTEIGFVVAVDFTGSNGDPRLPTSLHYFAGGPTQYEQAIMGIGHVIMHYDHDKAFPMFGFGGRKHGGVDHCFPLGPGGSCQGVEGLLAEYRYLQIEYRQALSEWVLSGPTWFAPVIRTATNTAADTVRAGGAPKYTCLLILTDGEVQDMAATVNAIIDASSLPLSILIVGVGTADFSKMKTLDGDHKRLSNGSRIAARDIVQFVELCKFAYDGERLAQELLAELPGQLVDYFKRVNIMPPGMPPPAAHGAAVPASFVA